MTYNSTDRRHIREAKKLARQDNMARYFTINQLMSSVQGRQWTFGLLSQCHIFTASFNPNALSMAYNEGQRNIGLALMADIIAVCPEQYITLMREANDRQLAADARNAASTSDSSDSGVDEPTSDGPEGADAERG